MSGPVDVQAERLRELAGKIRANAGSYGNEEFWKHLAFDAADGLDEAGALLAGQTEQIERLTHQRDKAMQLLEADPLRSGAAALNGLRKILAEEDGRIDRILNWIGVAADETLTRADRVRILALELATKQGYTLDEAEAALRAAVVGEDERREKSRDEWEREYDDAVQCRDWQTCDQLLAEREGLSWWPVGEDTE